MTFLLPSDVFSRLMPTLGYSKLQTSGTDGNGRSSFIEALGGGHELGISGDSLEAVTQEITRYEAVNVEKAYRRPLSPDPILHHRLPWFRRRHLVGVQGDLSLNLLLHTLATQSATSNKLYFHRISYKRASGSQKKTLGLVKSLVGRYGGGRWTGVVTTMWDTLWRPEQLAGLNAYESEKDSFGPPPDMTFRFDNTQESALRILDDTPTAAFLSLRDPPLLVYRAKSIRTGPFAIPVYQDPMDRMSAPQQRIRALESDIEEQEQGGDAELLSRLFQDRVEAESLLGSLEKDQRDFGSPPDLLVENPSLSIESTPGANEDSANNSAIFSI
ncbi:hypothetical protein BJ165DRAFT_1410052 [Panaeolus papilionaceus]|nr:hypothetical protein BJ165DRAFT_1410052 [Panaeolus papilionaceus]